MVDSESLPVWLLSVAKDYNATHVAMIVMAHGSYHLVNIYENNDRFHLVCMYIEFPCFHSQSVTSLSPLSYSVASHCDKKNDPHLSFPQFKTSNAGLNSIQFFHETMRKIITIIMTKTRTVTGNLPVSI